MSEFCGHGKTCAVTDRRPEGCTREEVEEKGCICGWFCFDREECIPECAKGGEE